MTEQWTENNSMGFKQTEEQKILAAVRDVLLSKEFLTVLSQYISDYASLPTALAVPTCYQTNCHKDDTTPINESSNDGT